MNKLLLNLQMFAEGGGEGASSTTGSEINGSEGASKGASKGKGESLSDVVYGKQSAELIADSNGEVVDTPKTKSQMFDDFIKGEYKEEFQKRTQSIIDKRFKETKSLEERLQSHDAILNLLSDKYGVDAKDVKQLQKAIEADETFYEQEAMEKGLTVEQLKELKQLQRENEAFRNAEAEAEARQKSQEIYSQWTQQAEELKAKYGLDNFSLQEEVQNPDFTALLRNGISVEAAYKAVHMDEMLGGAMAKTANEVRSQMSNSIASRQSRPSENGVSPKSSQVFKTDVNSLTKKDRDEIEKRVMRGASISF